MSEEHYGGRVPPHNLEAERAVVGALMVDPVRVSEVAEKLVPEDFYDQRVGEVYRQILELENRAFRLTS